MLGSSVSITHRHPGLVSNKPGQMRITDSVSLVSARVSGCICQGAVLHAFSGQCFPRNMRENISVFFVWSGKSIIGIPCLTNAVTGRRACSHSTASLPAFQNDFQQEPNLSLVKLLSARIFACRISVSKGIGLCMEDRRKK